MFKHASLVGSIEPIAIEGEDGFTLAFDLSVKQAPAIPVRADVAGADRFQIAVVAGRLRAGREKFRSAYERLEFS